ncbi:MAG: ThuA domain-containing protein [Planctomycetes bacterium]|nr:ThuA domain-containing protein [Planctomycetota bacterium]
MVEGALRFPTREELERTDVLVLYAAEAGSIHGEERAVLEAYLARGGGLVAIHDAVCGDDPHWFKTVVGGAWEHGHAKWATGTTDLYVRDFDHPITRGVANWRFEDELYTELHLEPDAHVLMAGFQDVFTISPQMWTYEKANYRAFVAIQGHFKKSFEHDAWRTLLLRGIAWAGKRDADSLTTPEERATLAYPTGGPLRPEEARKALVLHEGFEASLAAAEPLIANPISIDWDPRGRLWVAETPGYPMKEKFSGIPAHDTISVLEDSDGDGVMDRKQVFADKLDLVTSFVFHQDGVIALAAPDILFLRDTDGDGVCDRREILFTGFGYGDTHAVMSNARWGLDGWIYATQATPAAARPMPEFRSGRRAPLRTDRQRHLPFQGRRQRDRNRVLVRLEHLGARLHARGRAVLLHGERGAPAPRGRAREGALAARGSPVWSRGPTCPTTTAWCRSSSATRRTGRSTSSAASPRRRAAACTTAARGPRNTRDASTSRSRPSTWCTRTCCRRRARPSRRRRVASRSFWRARIFGSAPCTCASDPRGAIYVLDFYNPGCSAQRHARPPARPHQRRLAARPRPHPRPDLARAASRRDGRGGGGTNGSRRREARRGVEVAERLETRDGAAVVVRGTFPGCRPGTGASPARHGQHDGLRGGALGARPVGQAGR